MGFNGKGAEFVSKRVREARFSGALPVHFRIGLNIGKNKATPDSDAHLDYAEALKPFQNLVDYVVVNLSSPNTPGLRALQAAEPLQKILKAVYEVLGDWSIRPPVLVKLAPELSDEHLEGILQAAEVSGASGFVLSNTWAGEWRGKNAEQTFAGGWSGSILTDPASKILERARKKTKLPLISVGGILNIYEAKRRIHLGADLIQVYTGWIYGGPTFARELSDALSELPKRPDTRPLNLPS
jgi:dihydroorotate dehydrogenase